MPGDFRQTLPPWLRWIEGVVPVVLVAPHGGRRRAGAPIQDNVKVNDVYTAQLTEILAARTGGYALINDGMDRNLLDLNRLSQVRARAPWFLSLLADLLRLLVWRHGEARVFFIHGWNVVQPVCDVGVGLAERSGRLVPVRKVKPTLSPEFFAAEILPFRAAGRARGIDIAVGRRYPAADQNNVMRLFCANHGADPGPPVPTLARLAAAGAVNAAQLELGIALRWPGVERDRFIEVFCDTLGRHKQRMPGGRAGFAEVADAPPAAAAVARRRLPFPGLAVSRLPLRVGLHFHDPRSGLGLLGGLESNPSSPRSSGRLLLILDRAELALFTGEDDGDAEPDTASVGGLVWRARERGVTIAFRGTLMRLSHPEAFIRLEEGLATSHIEPAEILLRLDVEPPARDGAAPFLLSRVRGRVRLSDRVHEVDAWGFVDVLSPRDAGRLLPRRLLSLPFGPDLGVFISRVEAEGGARSWGVVYHEGVAHTLGPADWKLSCALNGQRPRSFHLVLRGGAPVDLSCRAESLAAVPVVRHAVEGRALAATFGLVRAEWAGREALGVYEFSVPRNA